MGCTHSKRSTGPSFVYKAVNIDNNGNVASEGLFKITSNSLEFIIKGNKSYSFLWPMSTVRKYGYENLLFCFDAGRLSPLGQGVFAFRSKSAKQIFDTVQEELFKVDKCMAEDISLDIRKYSGLTSSYTNLFEKVHGEVQFGTLKYSDSDDEDMYSPDIMESDDILFSQSSSSTNVFNYNDLRNIDIFSSNHYPLPSEDITYTEVEIAECPIKNRNLNNRVTPLEASDYQVIDFDQTKNLSRIMFKSTGEPGLIKTRHDFPSDDSEYY